MSKLRLQNERYGIEMYIVRIRHRHRDDSRVTEAIAEAQRYLQKWPNSGSLPHMPTGVKSLLRCSLHFSLADEGPQEVII